jgi:hypothetical protein
MASEPPDSDDPFKKYDRKRAEDAKKAAEQPETPAEGGGSGADPPKNGPDNVVPISQGRRSNTKPKKDPPDVKGIVEATSELSLQQKFSEIHGESLQFVDATGKWYHWNGERLAARRHQPHLQPAQAIPLGHSASLPMGRRGQTPRFLPHRPQSQIPCPVGPTPRRIH